MTDIAYLTQNNTSPTLDALLTNAAGKAVNVSGASVRFHLRLIGETALKVDAAATVVDGEAGHVRYILQPGDTDTPGRYKAEFEVTFLDGSVETFTNTPTKLRVVITPELG